MRVILLCNQYLFGESLAQVLSSQDDVEILGCWPLNQDLLTLIDSNSPDVLLIGEEDQDRQWITCLTGQILESHNDMLVIRMNLDRSNFRIYSSHVLPARSSELIELVHNLPTLQGSEHEKLEGGGE